MLWFTKKKEKKPVFRFLDGGKMGEIGGIFNSDGSFCVWFTRNVGK